MSNNPPEWELIQSRTFTRWINAQIKKRGLKIEDIIKDLEDGLVLLNLYEIISDTSLGKYDKQPKGKIQQLANLRIVIKEINKFVSSVGIKIQYSAEQVNSGDKRTILGLIWCLIHKFEIQDISEEQLSAKEGLLLWCQKKTQGYKNVKVKNFTDSWQSGLAFCALIHKHRPDLLDFDSLDPNDNKGNLEKAFSIADKELDIPELLDANEMVSYKPDEKSVMTYVAYYWKKFASSNKTEKAARKVNRVVKNQRTNEEMETDYEKRAKALIQWITTKGDSFKEPAVEKFGDNLKKVQEFNTEFTKYKNVEKPVNNNEKSDLGLLLANLQSKQRSEGVTVYTPPTGLHTDDIQKAWEDLENYQKEYSVVLKKALIRMKHLESLLAKFRSKSNKVLSWCSEKQDYLSQKVSEDIDIQSLRAKINSFGGFEQELKSIEGIKDTTCTFGEELINEKHQSKDEAKETIDKMNNALKEVAEKSQQTRKEMDDLLKKKLEIEQLCVEFAKDSEALYLFLEDCSLTLSEPAVASSVSDVEKLIKDAHGLNDKLTSEMKKVLENIQKVHSTVSEQKQNPEAFSRITKDQNEKKYSQVEQDLKQRLVDLDKEKERQVANESLLNKLHTECKSYIEFVDNSLKVIAEDPEGTEEEKLAKVEKFGQESLTSSEDKLKEIKSTCDKIDEADISEQADYSYQEMESKGDQIKNAVKKRIQALQEQIFQKKMGAVSKEQLQEFHETFKHFDKQNRNKLNKLEFKAACASVGEDIPENVLETTFKAYDKDDDGFINFEEFIEFMSNVVKEGTGYDDVVDSFRTITGGKDIITASQLQANLEKEEAEYLMNKMPKVEGGYDFVAYAKKTYGK